jgi:hypothetical protein
MGVVLKEKINDLLVPFLEISYLNCHSEPAYFWMGLLNPDASDDGDDFTLPWVINIVLDGCLILHLQIPQFFELSVYPLVLFHCLIPQFFSYLP